MQRRHVNLIHIGPFFAIDFDVDEELVHDARNGRVFEALVRHHVAPVTRRIADRQQNRLVGSLGLREGFRPPGPPMDRIVLVLQKVGARLAAEAIFRMCLDGSVHRRVPSGVQEDNVPEVSGTNRSRLKSSR